VVESLLRLDLAVAGPLQITAFDVSPRVLRHMRDARERARTGADYSVVLARNPRTMWSAELDGYWQQFGNWTGAKTTRIPQPPPATGPVQLRGIVMRPAVVLSIAPVDLDIVTERLEPGPDDQFDVIIATNILLYYDVFEQSLASANIARMLRPGGYFLTNNRVFELPGSPLSGVEYVDVAYLSLPGIGQTGDRVIWYQKQ
jgi:hypothetical protein